MRRKVRRASWLWIVPLAIFFELLAIALTWWLAASWHLSTSDMIDLGQLIVALVLLPFGVVAFWQAAEAVKQSSARPSIRIAFLGEDGLLHDTYVMRLPALGGAANRVTLALENNGDAIAVWWQASFDIPVGLMKALRFGNNAVNVMPREIPTVMMDTVGDVERRVVQSAGKTGLFPGPPLQIASLQAEVRGEVAPHIAGTHQLGYRLLTDRSDEVTGHLPLTIEVVRDR